MSNGLAFRYINVLAFSNISIFNLIPPVSSFCLHLLYENRQTKIQSAKFPQYVQIPYDKIASPIIVSNRLLRHTPAFAIRMGVASLIFFKLPGRRELNLMCAKQRFHDCIQIHIHSASALLIKAAPRRADKIYRLKSRINYTYVSRCLAQRVQ